MTWSEFSEGWNFIHQWFNRIINERQAELVYSESFTRKGAQHFMTACRNITKKYDNLPYNLGKVILHEIAEISYGVLREERTGCEKCDKGRIHYKLIYDGAAHNMVGACDCADGRELSDELNANRIPPFFIGILARRGIDDYTYKGEVVVVETTPREAINGKYWYRVCEIRNWSRDIVKDGRLKYDSRILLKLEDAVAVGIKRAIRLKEDLNAQEDLSKQFAKKDAKPKDILQNYIKKIRKKNTAIKQDLDKATNEVRTEEKKAELEEAESFLPRSKKR